MKNKNKVSAVIALIIGLSFMSLVGCTKSYSLGDTCPGGGKIFYYSEAGFTMTVTGKICHYLEAAPSDMPTELKWALERNYETNISGTETGIGTGRKNTALILSTDANAPAIIACKEYSNNGKSDWFLPSKDELNELYKVKNYIDNTGTSWYWSSSQDYNDNLSAWVQYFGDGDQDYFYKYYNQDIRAVRVF